MMTNNIITIGMNSDIAEEKAELDAENMWEQTFVDRLFSSICFTQNL